MLGTSKATHGPPLETKPAKAMLGMSKATHGPPLETTKKETTKKETTKKVAKVVIPKPVYPDRSGMSVAERVAALHADAGSVHNQIKAAGAHWGKLKNAVKALSGFMHKSKPAAAAQEEEEEDEFDLFGSDDEDDAELEARVKAAQEKIDAKNQVKGKVLIAKSALTLDVKPWEVRQHY